jgi:hypothetical protein
MKKKKHLQYYITMFKNTVKSRISTNIFLINDVTIMNVIIISQNINPQFLIPNQT